MDTRTGPLHVPAPLPPWRTVLEKPIESRTPEDVSLLVKWFRPFLVDIPFLLELDRPVFRQLCASFQVFEAPAETVIVQQGTIGSLFYVIIDGSVAVHVLREPNCSGSGGDDEFELFRDSAASIPESTRTPAGTARASLTSPFSSPRKTSLSKPAGFDPAFSRLRSAAAAGRSALRRRRAALLSGPLVGSPRPQPRAQLAPPVATRATSTTSPHLTPHAVPRVVSFATASLASSATAPGSGPSTASGGSVPLALSGSAPETVSVDVPPDRSVTDAGVCDFSADDAAPPNNARRTSVSTVSAAVTGTPAHASGHTPASSDYRLSSALPLAPPSPPRSHPHSCRASGATAVVVPVLPLSELASPSQHATAGSDAPESTDTTAAAIAESTYGPVAAVLGPGRFFGEVALTAAVPTARTATCVARGRCLLLTLSHTAFRAALDAESFGVAALADRRALISTVFPLSRLPPADAGAAPYWLHPLRLTREHAVYRAGERAAFIYFVRSGTLRMQVSVPLLNGARAATATLAEFGPGSFFGDDEHFGSTVADALDGSTAAGAGISRVFMAPQLTPHHLGAASLFDPPRAAMSAAVQRASLAATTAVGVAAAARTGASSVPRADSRRAARAHARAAEDSAATGNTAYDPRALFPDLRGNESVSATASAQVTSADGDGAGGSDDDGITRGDTYGDTVLDTCTGTHAEARLDLHTDGDGDGFLDHVRVGAVGRASERSNSADSRGSRHPSIGDEDAAGAAPSPYADTDAAFLYGPLHLADAGVLGGRRTPPSGVASRPSTATASTAAAAVSAAVPAAAARQAARPLTASGSRGALTPAFSGAVERALDAIEAEGDGARWATERAVADAGTATSIGDASVRAFFPSHAAAIAAVAAAPGVVCSRPGSALGTAVQSLVERRLALGLPPVPSPADEGYAQYSYAHRQRLGMPLPPARGRPASAAIFNRRGSVVSSVQTAAAAAASAAAAAASSGAASSTGVPPEMRRRASLADVSDAARTLTVHGVLYATHEAAASDAAAAVAASAAGEFAPFSARHRGLVKRAEQLLAGPQSHRGSGAAGDGFGDDADGAARGLPAGSPIESHTVAGLGASNAGVPSRPSTAPRLGRRASVAMLRALDAAAADALHTLSSSQPALGTATSGPTGATTVPGTARAARLQRGLAWAERAATSAPLRTATVTVASASAELYALPVAMLWRFFPEGGALHAELAALAAHRAARRAETVSALQTQTQSLADGALSAPLPAWRAGSWHLDATRADCVGQHDGIGRSDNRRARLFGDDDLGRRLIATDYDAVKYSAARYEQSAGYTNYDTDVAGRRVREAQAEFMDKLYSAAKRVSAQQHRNQQRHASTVAAAFSAHSRKAHRLGMGAARAPPPASAVAELLSADGLAQLATEPAPESARGPVVSAQDAAGTAVLLQSRPAPVPAYSSGARTVGRQAPGYPLPTRQAELAAAQRTAAVTALSRTRPLLLGSSGLRELQAQQRAHAKAVAAAADASTATGRQAARIPHERIPSARALAYAHDQRLISRHSNQEALVKVAVTKQYH